MYIFPLELRHNIISVTMPKTLLNLFYLKHFFFNSQIIIILNNDTLQRYRYKYLFT